MRSLGVPNALVTGAGGHESALGQRLETGLLPTMSRRLQNAVEPQPKRTAAVPRGPAGARKLADFARN
jgi:hypothetical protein